MMTDASPTPEILLFPGSKFANIEDAKKSVEAFNKVNHVDYVIETNNKQTLRFLCKHGCRQRKRSKGERKTQHYNAIRCGALINFYKSRKKDGSLNCTQVVVEHNHPVSEHIYNSEHASLTEDEGNLCATLRSGNCKPSQIKRVILERFTKTITIQKLKNILSQVPDGLDKVDPEEFFEKFEGEGGEVDWELDPDGTVKCIALSSKKMMNAFKSSDPPLIQLDTTFEIEAARYKVLACVYLNPTSNKSEIAFLALVCDETKPNIEFALRAFKRICVRNDLIFSVDKDFGQIYVLHDVFPQSVVLLCIFHAIKYMKVLFASAPVLMEKKKELLDQFRKVLYSNTEEKFKAEDDKFVKVCGDITVKTGDKQSPLGDYYIRNWRSCKEMWVKHYRKHLPRLGDNTSNRVEKMFWTLKKSIQDTFMTLPPTVTAAVHLIQFADKRLEEKYLFATNKSTVIFDSNEKITELNVEASTVLNDRGCALFYAAQKRMEDRKVKFEMVEDGVVEHFSEESKSYQTSERICNCTFFFDHQAPCSHILFIRTELFPDDIFSPDLFHKRYHRPLNVLANLQDPQEVEQTDPVNEEASRVEPLDTFEQEEEVALSDEQKYKLVTPIVMRIGNLIACHPTKKFLQYLDALNELERRVRRGQNFMMHIHNILATIDESEDESGNDEVAELDEEQIGDSCDADLLDDGGDGGDVREAGDIGGRADDAMSVVDIDVNDNIVFANDSQDTVIQDEFYQEEVLDQTSETSSKRKFDLAFKVGLKTKGRPKKKCKQFSFNKTVVDRKKSKQDKAKKAVLVEKVAKKKVAKKTASKNKKKKDFLDDSSSEEFISDKELVDDSSDDDLDVSDESQDTEVMFKCSICGQSISPDYPAPYCGICKSVFHQNCEDDYGCVKCSN